jgi:hypothetical protein
MAIMLLRGQLVSLTLQKQHFEKSITESVGCDLLSFSIFDTTKTTILNAEEIKRRCDLLSFSIFDTTKTTWRQ